jgi:hypothetical protein
MHHKITKRIYERKHQTEQAPPRPSEEDDSTSPGRSGHGAESALAHLIEQEEVRTRKTHRG